MGQYRKKPVVIEAMQYEVHKGWIVERWSNGAAMQSPVNEPSDDNPTGEYLQIKTLEGVMTAIPGDYIIRGVKGEFYPCKPDIFAATYEDTSESPDPAALMVAVREVVGCWSAVLGAHRSADRALRTEELDAALRRLGEVMGK